MLYELTEQGDRVPDQLKDHVTQLLIGSSVDIVEVSGLTNLKFLSICYNPYIESIRSLPNLDMLICSYSMNLYRIENVPVLRYLNCVYCDQQIDIVGSTKLKELYYKGSHISGMIRNPNNLLWHIVNLGDRIAIGSMVKTAEEWDMAVYVNNKYIVPERALLIWLNYREYLLRSMKKFKYNYSIENIVNLENQYASY